MPFIGIITVLLSLAVTGIGLTAQVRKNYRRKTMVGLSPVYFVLLAISYTFWVVYGVSQYDLVLIVPMSLGALMSWTVAVQFALYRRAEAP